MTNIQSLGSFNISVNGAVNDYKYSQNGLLLALCDSQGYIYIYQKDKENKMIKKYRFRVDEGPALSLSWADPKYGNILGIGTYSNKVFVYQEHIEGWKQIAHNFSHQASVNCVRWSPCGLKLYSGSSDAKISILQCSKKNWSIKNFSSRNQAPILAISLQPVPLGQYIDPLKSDSFYPRIAVAKKDMKIEIYSNGSANEYQQNPKEKGYKLIKQYDTSKQILKDMLWKVRWGSLNQNQNIISLVYCTEEGSLKSIDIIDNEIHANLLNKNEVSYCQIQQSLTGNIIAATCCYKDRHEVQIFEEQDNQWALIERKKI